MSEPRLEVLTKCDKCRMIITWRGPRPFNVCMCEQPMVRCDPPQPDTDAARLARFNRLAEEADRVAKRDRHKSSCCCYRCLLVAIHKKEG